MHGPLGFSSFKSARNSSASLPQTPISSSPPPPRLVFFSWVSFPWINSSNLGSTSVAYFFSDQRSTRSFSPILSTQIALRNLSRCTIPTNVSLVYPVSRLYASLSSYADFFYKLPVCMAVHRTSEPIQVHLQEWVSPIDHRPLSPTKSWKLTSQLLPPVWLPPEWPLLVRRRCRGCSRQTPSSPVDRRAFPPIFNRPQTCPTSTSRPPSSD